MKKSLFISLFLFSMLSCFSQDILELEYLNQYKRKQIYWLTKKGFDIFNYSGNNEIINLNLDLAIKHRETANNYLIYGGAGILLLTAGILSLDLNFITISTIVFHISLWSSLVGNGLHNNYAKRRVNAARERLL